VVVLQQPPNWGQIILSSCPWCDSSFCEQPTPLRSRGSKLWRYDGDVGVMSEPVSSVAIQVGLEDIIPVFESSVGCDQQDERS
jgi:hypothetical protein